MAWIWGVSLQNGPTFASVRHIRDSARFPLSFWCRVFCTSKELYVWALNIQSPRGRPGLSVSCQSLYFLNPEKSSSLLGLLGWHSSRALPPPAPRLMVVMVPGFSWLPAIGALHILLTFSSFLSPCVDVNISPSDHWILSLSLTLEVENFPDYFGKGAVREKYYHTQ